MGKTVKEVLAAEYGDDTDQFKTFTSLIIEEETIIELTEEDKKLIESMEKLTYLAFSSCKLKSLNNFPKVAELEKLELYDNNISSGLEMLLQYPKLKVLKLGGNRVSKFEEIEKLSELKHLENIDLVSNPIANDAEYK